MRSSSYTTKCNLPIEQQCDSLHYDTTFVPSAIRLHSYQTQVEQTYGLSTSCLLHSAGLSAGGSAGAAAAAVAALSEDDEDPLEDFL